jgi:hypothetical protein
MKLAALAILATMLAAAQPDMRLAAPDSDRSEPVTASIAARRLDDMAERLHLANVGAPRLAIFDLAWPASQREYEALGRNGVLQVSVVVADASELPVRRAYVRDETGEHELKWIGAARFTVPPAAAAHAIGAFREDSYYLLPLTLADHHGVALIDFAAHRKEFDLATFPQQPPPFASAEMAPHVDAAALSAFVKREFQGSPPVALGQ